MPGGLGGAGGSTYGGANTASNPGFGSQYTGGPLGNASTGNIIGSLGGFGGGGGGGGGGYGGGGGFGGYGGGYSGNLAAAGGTGNFFGGGGGFAYGGQPVSGAQNLGGQNQVSSTPGGATYGGNQGGQGAQGGQGGGQRYASAATSDQPYQVAENQGVVPAQGPQGFNPATGFGNTMSGLANQWMGQSVSPVTGSAVPGGDTSAGVVGNPNAFSNAFQGASGYNVQPNTMAAQQTQGAGAPGTQAGQAVSPPPQPPPQPPAPPQPQAVSPTGDPGTAGVQGAAGTQAGQPEAPETAASDTEATDPARDAQAQTQQQGQYSHPNQVPQQVRQFLQGLMQMLPPGLRQMLAPFLAQMMGGQSPGPQGQEPSGPGLYPGQTVQGPDGNMYRVEQGGRITRVDGGQPGQPSRQPPSESPAAVPPRRPDEESTDQPSSDQPPPPDPNANQDWRRSYPQNLSPPSERPSAADSPPPDTSGAVRAMTEGMQRGAGDQYSQQQHPGESPPNAPSPAGPDVPSARKVAPGSVPPPSQGLGAIRGPAQMSRPPHYTGTLSLGGQQFRFGTGGGRTQSLPYGTYNITNAVGPVGRRIGAVGGISDSGGGNSVNDPKTGVPRVGVEIHPSGRGITDGCIGIDRRQWPAFQRAFNQARANGQRLVLQVNPDHSASIYARGAQAGTAPSAARNYNAARNPASQRTLGMIRQRESGGNYRSTPQQNYAYPRSHASGAYQIEPATWRQWTRSSGIGTQYREAYLAPPQVQDAVAAWALQRYGPNSSYTWRASAPRGGYPTGAGMAFQ